ncbi:universal stress protein [Parafrankia discariae]|uniref:universal stress protein n=1 Tax=Parafrankia discariae TaxID=365528 RepID=UPI00036989DF|nr:universal stress protein [Parafrankia discariae]
MTDGALTGIEAARTSERTARPATERHREPTHGTATDIVVGIDGSPGAAVALAWAVTEAGRRGLRVRAVLGSCAGEQPTAVRRSADAVAGPHDEATLAFAASHVLHETIGAAPIPAGLEVLEEVVDAPGAEALLTAGRDAAMIVVGARGRGLLHRLRLGSVSTSVAVHSPVPVVVTRPPRSGDAEDPGTDGLAGAGSAAGDRLSAASAPGPGSPHRRPVVVGVDGSPNSLAALLWAAVAAALRGAPLHVVHGWLAAVSLPFAETSGEIVRAIEGQAQAVLDESVEQVLGPFTGDGPGEAGKPGESGEPGKPGEPGRPAGPAGSGAAVLRFDAPAPGSGKIEVCRQLVPASATRALLEASRDADLLVVGARGKGGFAELLLGSVSHQTMLHSAAPVAIIRA